MRADRSMSSQISTLIIATSAVQVANGFFGTFFSLRVALAEFDAVVAGLVLSSYFGGFTIGAYFCGRIIERYGHIRAYAAFAGTVVAATAAMALTNAALPWMILRAIIGLGCAGLFVTTESWLNAKAPPSERGWVFSIYMVGTFGALAAGQLVIGWVDLATTTPFNIIIALFAIALVLVSTTSAEAPRIATTTSLPYGQLSRAAPVAVAGAALAGLITGSFYSLVPAWMEGENIERSTTGLFMLVAILGGFVFQIPVGRLSDRFDRRIVLAILSACFAAAAVMIVWLPRSLSAILPLAVILGGLMSTIYPVCVAHAHDRLPADRVIAVSGWLILISGFGSVIGPLIGTSVMRHYDIDGVFYVMAGAAILLAIFTIGRTLAVAPPEHHDRTFDILAPQATPLAHDPGDTAK